MLIFDVLQNVQTIELCFGNFKLFVPGEDANSTSDIYYHIILSDLLQKQLRLGASEGVDVELVENSC